MRNEMPLIERDETGFEVEKKSRLNRVGSLLGSMAALVLIVGLVAIFGLNAGKGPSGNGNPGVGAQPVTTNTALALTPTQKPASSPAATTADPNPTPTPVPFDSRTPVPTAKDGTPTPTAAVIPGKKPADSTPLKLDRADNVNLVGLVNLPVDYDASTMPEIYQPTKPEGYFYASKNSPSFIEGNIYDALIQAGYTVTDPFVSAASNGGNIPQGGVFIYAKKAGQPDLYINLVSIADEAEISKASKGGFFNSAKDFETQANSISAKGYPSLVFVLSGDNLLKTINGGTDVFTGVSDNPNLASPTPVK